MCPCGRSHRRDGCGLNASGRTAARSVAPGRRKGEPYCELFFVLTTLFTASTFALSPADRTVTLTERDTPDWMVLFADTVITTVRVAPAGTDTKYVPLAT